MKYYNIVFPNVGTFGHQNMIVAAKNILAINPEAAILKAREKLQTRIPEQDWQSQALRAIPM